MIDHSDSPDMRHPAERNEATERIDPADPTLPIDSTEPMEPIDSTESRDPMQSTECCERYDQRDPSSFVFTGSLPSCCH
jgi:hypothetical protein